MSKAAANIRTQRAERSRTPGGNSSRQHLWKRPRPPPAKGHQPSRATRGKATALSAEQDASESWTHLMYSTYSSAELSTTTRSIGAPRASPSKAGARARHHQRSFPNSERQKSRPQSFALQSLGDGKTTGDFKNSGGADTRCTGAYMACRFSCSRKCFENDLYSAVASLMFSSASLSLKTVSSAQVPGEFFATSGGRSWPPLPKNNSRSLFAQ
mmetsp:Transcript_87172/g.251414  ORF Transcript_87172/g.251414 Transcript_87172/m.251414 type:complete len:213 (+) Transcript_87172:750-1388(+)